MTRPRAAPGRRGAGTGRGVGEDPVEADLDVPGADFPAAGGVVAVVGAGEEVAKPGQQGGREPVYLRAWPPVKTLWASGCRAISA